MMNPNAFIDANRSFVTAPMFTLAPPSQEALEQARRFATEAVSLEEIGQRMGVSVLPRAVNNLNDSLMADDLHQKDMNFFERKLEQIVVEFPFVPAWAMGEDLSNMLVDEELSHRLEWGGQAKTTDPMGRRVIITKTMFGLVIVYQRYAEGTNTINFYAPEIFHQTNLIRSTNGRLDSHELVRVLGSVCDLSIPTDADHRDITPNIGIVTKKLAEALAVVDEE